MYFALGFAEMQFAEDYLQRPYVRRSPMRKHTNLYALDLVAGRHEARAVHSIPRSTLANGNGRGLGEREKRRIIAKGRAQVFLGQFPQAAAAVASVATTYQYVETFSQTSQDNGFWVMTTNSSAI